MTTEHSHPTGFPRLPTDGAGPSADSAQDDPWFLPGPALADWRRAEAGLAAALARVAGRLGGLDDRLRRGPAGWRHHLALIEAADLGWHVGDRITPDRLALWASLRLAGVQRDTAALARAGWAVQRLTGGPGPEPDLAAFLGRHDPDRVEIDAEPLGDRAGGWLDLMASIADMHPISRACTGFHFWGLSGLGYPGDSIEAAVTAARIAAGDGTGAVFAPLAMGGAGGLRVGGPPAARLSRWLEGMETAILAAMRRLDDLEAWAARADAAMAPLSGRTPPALRAALTAWPLLSAPMAETLTGASRAAVQRNLAWLEERGLVREITGQARFRMWRAAV